MEVQEITEKEFTAICNSQNQHFLQSWAWGDVKSPQWKAVRLLVNNTPYSLLLRKIPLINNHFVYIGRPFSNTFSPEQLEADLTQIQSYLKTKYSISHIEIDPNITEGSQLEDIFTKLGYRSSGEQIQPGATDIIDLSPGIEELSKKLSSQTRNKINKAASLGAKSEIFTYKENRRDNLNGGHRDNSSGINQNQHSGDNDDGVNRFFEIIASISNNTNFVTHGKEYFKKLWSQMGRSNQVFIVIISLEGKDLGGYLCTHNNETVYELYGGLNEYGRSIRGAGYFLKWESIKYSCSKGFKLYDQWGSAPIKNGEYDKKHPLYHISQFKKEFMGEHVQYMPKQTLVLNQFGYTIYKVGIALNKMLIKLKR